MERLSYLESHLYASQRKEAAAQVLKEWRGNCLKIILNRPKAYNALCSKMNPELFKAIEEANQSAKVCIVKSILAGKVFSAGGDIKELVAMKKNGTQAALIRQFNSLMFAMSQAKPIKIAFWDGIVMGAGVGLSVNSNIKIATENTAFAMPEAKLGHFTDVGASYFLSRLKKNIGLFLALTAYSLKGKQAYQVGVADYFVNSKDLPALEAEIEELSLDPTVNEALIRKTIEKYAEKIPQVYEGEDLIAEIFQGKDVSEVLEKLKQKSEENATVKKWYEDILKNSAISLFYGFELLKRGKKLNLHEALSIEEYLASKERQEDLYEGVRIVLVDKGARPNWKTTLQDIPALKVEEFFPEQIKLIDYQSYLDQLHV